MKTIATKCECTSETAVGLFMCDYCRAKYTLNIEWRPVAK